MKNIPPIKELREICQKPVADKNSVLGRIFGRSISIYITKALLYTPITANQLTIIWGIIGIAAVILFAFGNYWYSIIGALLLMLAYLLDYVDGEIARYRKTTSAIGTYLDFLFYDTIKSLTFVGISFGVYNIFYNISAFVFGFLASLSVLWITIISRDKEQGGLRKLIFKSDAVKKGRLRQIISKVPMGPCSPEVMMGVILIGAIFNYMHIVLILYGIILPCYVVMEVYHEIKHNPSKRI